MDESITKFKVAYSSEKKEQVKAQIEETLKELTTLFGKTMDDWDTIKTKFTLSPAIKAKLDSIGSGDGSGEGGTGTEAEEFNKITTSFNNLIESLGAIDTSWSNVSSDIENAINNYSQKAE